MRRRGVLSLCDAWQEMSLGVGLLKKIVAGKKEFTGRSYENCHFYCRNLAVHLLLRWRWHSNSTWNWFHVFSYERLFSFCYWRGILSTRLFFQECDWHQAIFLSFSTHFFSSSYPCIASWCSSVMIASRELAVHYNHVLMMIPHLGDVSCSA